MKKSAKQPNKIGAANKVAGKAGPPQGLLQVSADEAEILLLAPSNKTGTYVLRPGAPGSGNYALSVKTQHAEKSSYAFVQHYNIILGKDGHYSVAPDSGFATVQELVDHYHENAGSLCCKLTVACPPQTAPVSGLDAEVHRDCIQLGELIGHGSNFEGYFATWNGTARVAVKVKNDRKQSSALFTILQEGNMLLSLSHANVIRFLGMCTTPGKHYAIFEPMENGSLTDYLRKDFGEHLNLKHLLDMAIQIVNAMIYIGSRRILHRDLRATHALVDDKNHVKLAHFGLARELNKDADCIHEIPKFTAKFNEKAAASNSDDWALSMYMPMEAAVNGLFSVKSDVWAFGVVLWEIVSFGAKPFGAMCGSAMILEMVDRGWRNAQPHGGSQSPVECDMNLYTIMLDCWRNTPENRPSFGELKDRLTAYAAKCKPKPPIVRKKLDPHGG